MVLRTKRIKEMSGLYNVGLYRKFLIFEPYSSIRYLYVGSPDDAKAEAQRIWKSKKFFNSPKIKEISYIL